MIEEGAMPEDIDEAMVNFGFPLGPMAVSDLSGKWIIINRRIP